MADTHKSACSHEVTSEFSGSEGKIHKNKSSNSIGKTNKKYISDFHLDKDNNVIDNMHQEFDIHDFLDINNKSEAEVDRCEFWTSANRVVRISKEHIYKKEKNDVNTNWNLDLFEEKLKITMTRK